MTAKTTKKKTARTGKKKAKPTRRKATKAKAPAKPITPAQEGQQITWLILGELKSTQIKFLRVGKLLCEVRDRKLYVAMKYPDMERYAEDRLRLRRTAYYQYVQAYDWVLEFHKEWLEPKPKGFIPDLSDVTDLIWLERELARTDLDASRRSTLEALRAKGLDGRLSRSEVDKVRRVGQKKSEGLKSFLSTLRRLRRRSPDLTELPAEAIARLEALIQIIEESMGSTGGTSGRK